MDKEILSKLKKEDIYPFLEDYYKKEGRTTPPDYKSYSLSELKKCLKVFGIVLVREKITS